LCNGGNVDSRVETKNKKRVLSKYEQNYSWSHPIGDHCIAHHDGAVSCIISWNGVDAELMSDDERQRVWINFYRLLGSLSEEYCIENHFWREKDNVLAQKYLDKNNEIIRCKDFAVHIREEHAKHLSMYSRKNEVAIVLTKLPVKKRFFAAKSQLAHQSREKEVLLKEANKLIKQLPGGSLMGVQFYLDKIKQSVRRTAYNKNKTATHNENMLLSEQAFMEAPKLTNNKILNEGTHSKVLLLYLYPDAYPAWFTMLGAITADIHISHIVFPTNTRGMMKKAEKETDFAAGIASKRGRDYSDKNIKDLASYRNIIAENNLDIFRNAFIIHISGDEIEVDNSTDLMIEWLEKNGAEIKSSDYIQLPFYRVAMPGQGYRSPFLRPDHTWQVADMMPVQVFDEGDQNPESLRLGEGSQLVGFNLTNQTIAHSFTVAMTGAGKGVEKGASIIETYPFGIDWYIAEVGQSYRWTVEALGGTYTTIDPDKNVVNPFPSFDVAFQHQDEQDIKDALPLSSKIVGGTIGSLAFLLTGGKPDFENPHQRASAQMVLQMLYASAENESREAPTMMDYFTEISEADYFENNEQKEAADFMAANLQSFLSTSEGKLFTKQNNLTLSDGITGVDLKDVLNASEELLKFYLVFISLRMSQLAYYRPNKARILLDEMHVFVKISPEVIGSLISGISRMGRKDHSFIDLVTQGIKEIDCIEDEVMNSMPLRTLLYRSDGHDEIASRISMNKGALDVWKNMPYPEGLSYRPGLRSVGEKYSNLHLTFSESVMALTDTSDLKLKERIAAETKDPIERIHKFYNTLRTGR